MPDEQLVFDFEELEELRQLTPDELLELRRLREMDNPARELLVTEKNEAQQNARHFLNLRIGALVFLITLLGATITFGWNNGYSEHWACLTTHEKWMRWLLLIFGWLAMMALHFVQVNLEHRYDSSWQYASDLEKALGIKHGLQQRLETTSFSVMTVRNMILVFLLLLYAASFALVIVNAVQLSNATGIDIKKECIHESE